MKQELKPCPFCDEQPEWSEAYSTIGYSTTAERSVYFISCKTEGCLSQSANISGIDKSTLIDKWNTRPNRSGKIDDKELETENKKLKSQIQELTASVGWAAFQLVKEKDINWEQRRWDLANDIYQTFTDSVMKMALKIQAEGGEMDFDSAEQSATRSLELADIFINKLKPKNGEKD